MCTVELSVPKESQRYTANEDDLHVNTKDRTSEKPSADVVSHVFPLVDILFTHRENPKVYKTQATCKRQVCHRDSRKQRLSHEELIRAQQD